MNGEQLSITVELTGLRPLMFDRYSGDNSTSLPVNEKMYLEGTQLTIPAINIYSLLCAENTKSVCRQFMGRAGKTIGLGISSYTTIDPFNIPILADGKIINFTGFNDQIYVHKTVARLAKGIPNPKERPTLTLPWCITFTMSYIDNKFCTLENLRQVITLGGTLGLGTFRPFFGRYELTQFEI